MLLIRMGYKMLLVWRCAPQDQENIDKDEMLLVGRDAQKNKQCRDEDVMLLIRIGNKTLLVWRCAPQEEGRGAQKKEQCRDEDVMLLIRIGNKMLLVWRCAPQEEEHIEKDEQLLVGDVLKRRRNVKIKM